MKNKNPYEVLGVSPSDDDQTIKKKYNTLIKRYHPDINKDAGSKEKFNEIYQAYEDIKNRKTTEKSYQDSGIDIDSIFKQYNRVNINQTIRTHVNVTFEELENGCDKVIGIDNSLFSFTIPPKTSPIKIFTISAKNKIIRVSLNPVQDNFIYKENKLTRIVKLTSTEFDQLNSVEVTNHINNHYKVSLKSGMTSNQILRIPNAGLNNQPMYVQLVIVKE